MAFKRRARRRASRWRRRHAATLAKASVQSRCATQLACNFRLRSEEPLFGSLASGNTTIVGSMKRNLRALGANMKLSIRNLVRLSNERRTSDSPASSSNSCIEFFPSLRTASTRSAHFSDAIGVSPVSRRLRRASNSLDSTNLRWVQTSGKHCRFFRVCSADEGDYRRAVFGLHDAHDHRRRFARSPPLGGGDDDEDEFNDALSVDSLPFLTSRYDNLDAKRVV